VLVKDLNDFHADLVISKGRVVAENEKMLLELQTINYPEWVRKSVHLPRAMAASDFILATSKKITVKANVIGVIENQAPTKHLSLEMPVEDGEVQADLSRDIAKVALIERHRNTGRVQIGLVKDLALTNPVQWHLQ